MSTESICWPLYLILYGLNILQSNELFLVMIAYFKKTNCSVLPTILMTWSRGLDYPFTDFTDLCLLY